MAHTWNQSYTADNLNRVAFPLGGIGAGMYCVEGTGAFSHLSLHHRPDVFHEPGLFAAIGIQGHPEQARLLEGPVPAWKAFGVRDSGNGSSGKTHGLPRFANCAFEARFPFAHIRLSDPALPLSASLCAWSPFIPGREDDCSLPAAALEYTITNNGDAPVSAVFSINAQNFMERQWGHGRIEASERGFILRQPPLEGKPADEGAFCIEIDDPAVQANLCWFRGGWFDGMTMAWRDIAEARCHAREAVTDPLPARSARGASLFLPLTLAPGATRTLRVLTSWYVPRSELWAGRTEEGATMEGRHKAWYVERFAGIAEVAAHWRAGCAELRAASARFSDCFYDSSLPPEVTEAVAANLTILKSPTVLRQHDGRIWAWEGCCDGAGCCHGTCTHVWNYAQALPHLFPALERGLRETEFNICQAPNGHQTFRANLPIGPVPVHYHAAADGQLGGIAKVYREWRISGDTEWLRGLWPRVRQSLDFAIATWDPQGLGTLIEPHHNTYDIEFWGPDGMCTSFYLAALRAAASMGRALGEEVSAYEALYTKGRAFMESELFNGDYFIQKIQWQGLKQKPPFEDPNGTEYSPEAVALAQVEGPKYQYGNGCLADGVLGAWMAEVCGLERILDDDQVRAHLDSVHNFNLRENLRDHANPQRPSYAFGDDGGLLLCTWPNGDAPALPFVYSNEVWTGIEYQVAAHLIMLGLVEEGLEVVRTARARYDGRIRNPFNEYECGHWYARALSSYSLLQALTGARYDAVEKTLYLAPAQPGDFRAFLCTATGYGTVGVRHGEPFCDVKEGSIVVEKLVYAKL